MDELPSELELHDLWNASKCQAELIQLSRSLAKTRIDGELWKLEGVSKSKCKQEGDHHWTWRTIVGARQQSSVWECVAVQTPDDEVQGAMIYRIDAKSFINSAWGTVYIDRLSTAPRNRPWLVDKPHYAGVGTGLLLLAICHSYLLGLEGRVSLTSLPTERTRQFYANRGFTATSEDADGMIDFELTAEAAQSWLQKEGLL